MKIRFCLALVLSLGLAAPASAADAPCERVQTGPTPFDQAARERQVASGEQRIAPLTPDQFTPEARQIVQDLQAFFGSKEEGVPVVFRTMFHHPGLFRGQMKLGLELNQNGKLPPRERELAILRTAWLVRSPFEWGEHAGYAKKYGLTSEDVERVTQGSSAPGWNEHDRALMRGVEELVGDHALSDETWNTLAKTWNEEQLLEFPGVVGSYTMTAMIYNSVRFGLMKGNEGFGQR
ncbi:MAG: carboxymuconolactone decarboxylase family protein [Novosphingobium sp.]